MKKKVFDSSVLGNRYHKSGNHIRINKAGIIYFSQDLTKELKGKRVNFIQDEARPADLKEMSPDFRCIDQLNSNQRTVEYYIDGMGDHAFVVMVDRGAVGGEVSIYKGQSVYRNAIIV